MKHNWCLELTSKQAEVLKQGLASHFRFLDLKPTYNLRNHTLTIQLSPMGRSLFPDERCEAFPNRLGKPVSIDSIRVENVSCYINGFIDALKKS
jgi:hypothetical protein